MYIIDESLFSHIFFSFGNFFWSMVFSGKLISGGQLATFFVVG